MDRLRDYRTIRGVRNFLGYVSLQQKYEVTGGSVLQLSFTWQAKENTPSRLEDGLTQKTEKRGLRLNFGSSFYVFFPPLPEPALCKVG